MINDLTPQLGLPLPNQNNDLSEDVVRLRSALTMLDGVVAGKASLVQINALLAAAPAALDTLFELAAALGNDANFAATVTNALALKAPKDSPAFTGTVSGVTAAMVGLGNVNNTSDADLLAAAALVSNARQAQLVSGSNLKTINGASLLDSGDLIVSIDCVAYASRADLRALTPAPNSLKLIDGLGLFRWDSGSTEVDDDETCFATSTGRWLLQLVHWDVLEARLGDLPGNLEGRAACPITSVSYNASASVNILVNGAQVGMTVCVVPPGPLPYSLSFYYYISEAGTVNVTFTTPLGTSTMPAGDWVATVFESA